MRRLLLCGVAIAAVHTPPWLMASPCWSLRPPYIVMFHARLVSLKLNDVTVSLFLLRSLRNTPSPPCPLCCRRRRRGRSFSAAPTLQPVASLSLRRAPDHVARLCSNSTFSWCRFRHRVAGRTIAGPPWPRLCSARALVRSLGALEEVRWGLGMGC